jgi:hypothetical protein
VRGAQRAPVARRRFFKGQTLNREIAMAACEQPLRARGDAGLGGTAEHRRCLQRDLSGFLCKRRPGHAGSLPSNMMAN